MGSIHRPPVSNLALALAQAGGLKLFVETGTFQGDSLRWASQHLERVWTVEINAQYQAEAHAKVVPSSSGAFAPICRARRCSGSTRMPEPGTSTMPTIAR